MLDPLRVKLISESASGLVSALISLPEATRNGVRLACVTCYEMLRFPACREFGKPCFRRKFLMNKWLCLFVSAFFDDN